MCTDFYVQIYYFVEDFHLKNKQKLTVFQQCIASVFPCVTVKFI